MLNTFIIYSHQDLTTFDVSDHLLFILKPADKIMKVV